MKEFDLIKLINNKPYIESNLKNNMHGILLQKKICSADVLFFNPNNLGDFVILEIGLKDFIVEKEELPQEIKNQLKIKLSSLKCNSKTKLEENKLKVFDIVELIVENDKYKKFGLNKGDRGCIIDDKIVKNHVLVDFNNINSCECFSINIDDLKLINS